MNASHPGRLPVHIPAGRALESLTDGELAVDLWLSEWLPGSFPGIISALFRVTHELNWLQEDEIVHLLDEHITLARCEANRVLADLQARGDRVNWLSATWRI